MSAEEREYRRTRKPSQPSPSISEVLASCAAADAVSTPPERPAQANVSANAAETAGHEPDEDERGRRAA